MHEFLAEQPEHVPSALNTQLLLHQLLDVPFEPAQARELVLTCVMVVPAARFVPDTDIPTVGSVEPMVRQSPLLVPLK